MCVFENRIGKRLLAVGFKVLLMCVCVYVCMCVCGKRAGELAVTSKSWKDDSLKRWVKHSGTHRMVNKKIKS